MDCPSEEQIIRMKLQAAVDINTLDFDLNNRTLSVYHTGDADQIFYQLHQLNLGTELIDSIEVDIARISNVSDERKLLFWVLGINFLFFLLEMSTGLISQSMGLIADSLDMLADSIVYGLALFAVGGTVSRKKNIARAAGYFQLTLALLGFIEVVRRFFGFENMPHFQTMVVVSIFALIANAICLYLLMKSKSKEAHMRASMIFTSNDVVVNLGVILAGVMVFITDSKYPDLIIGSIVFIIVGFGAFRILNLSR